MNYNITIDDRKYLWVTYLKLQVPIGAAQYSEDFQGFVPRLQSRNSASTLPDWLSRLQVVSSLSPHLSEESQPLTQYSWNPLWPQDLPLPPTPLLHQPPRPPQTAGWSGHSSESVAVIKQLETVHNRQTNKVEGAKQNTKERLKKVGPRVKVILLHFSKFVRFTVILRFIGYRSLIVSKHLIINLSVQILLVYTSRKLLSFLSSSQKKTSLLVFLLMSLYGRGTRTKK